MGDFKQILIRIKGGFPEYGTVWRWHFYAGLLSAPFVLFLALTGTIYLFKPQVEAWIDRPYDHLLLTGPNKTADEEVEAALSAVPGSTLDSYELPVDSHSAARVIIKDGKELLRVYIHPQTLQVLHLIKENKRIMNIIFLLHGELLSGNPGSVIVELAASWTIVMIITGLYLWWPRSNRNLAGVLFPRLKSGGRLFWRDLHSVSGVWISFFVLFLLLTGLPWAYFWGNYLKTVREWTHTDVVKEDWPIGTPTRLAVQSDQIQMDRSEIPAHHGQNNTINEMTRKDKIANLTASPINRIVEVISPFKLAAPVLISPSGNDINIWNVKSDAQNRTLRTELTVDASTGRILRRDDFKDHHLIDRIVGIGVSAHEGQLFGWVNQLMGLMTAFGLVILIISSAVMWWRRRPQGVLGAPINEPRSRNSIWTRGTVIVLAIYLPLFGISLLFIWLLARFILRRIPPVQVWLGLNVR